MAALALQHFGKATIMHLESPYGLPGYGEVIAWFRERATVHTIPASRDLADYVRWCHDVGLPHERDRNAQQKVVTEIKRDRAREWLDESYFVVECLGLRIEEKGPRARMLKAKGPLFRMASGRWRCCPIAYWTGRDVWAYLLACGIPYNHRLYDAETHGQTRESIRNTGWLSTDGAHDGRIAWLRQHFPDQYRILATEFPQVRSLT